MITHTVADNRPSAIQSMSRRQRPTNTPHWGRWATSSLRSPRSVPAPRQRRTHQPLNNRALGCERRSESAGLFVAVSRCLDGTVFLLPNERQRVPFGHADCIANARRRVTHIDIPVAARHSIENGTFDRSDPAQIMRGRWHPGVAPGGCSPLQARRYPTSRPSLRDAGLGPKSYGRRPSPRALMPGCGVGTARDLERA